MLLVKRGQEPLKGAVEPAGRRGRSRARRSQAALAREVREETGLDVEVGPVVEVLDSIRRDADGRVEYHYVIIDYACRVRAGTSSVASCGSDAADVGGSRPPTSSDTSVTPTAIAVIRKALASAASRT